MKPILFPKNTTDFSTNGIGRLDCISCDVVEGRNGVYEASIELLDTVKYFSAIEYLSIIVVKVSDGTKQPFRVVKIVNNLDGKTTLELEHLSYMLSNIPVNPFTASSASAALQGIKTNSAITNNFNFDTDIQTSGEYRLIEPQSARACLGGESGSVLQKWNGEYKFNGWNVSLLARRGADKNVTFTYGKNVTDFENEVSVEDTYTGVYPYWINENNVVVGNIVRSATPFAEERIAIEDVSGDVEVEQGATPTVAQVTEAGRRALQNKSYVSRPNQNIEISFVNLWETEEYKNIANIERVELCDTVNVKFTKYDLNVRMKVIKTEWDAINERFTKIELGDIKKTIVTQIAEITNDIGEINYQTEQMTIRLEKTEEGLETEVTKRREGDEALSTSITETAESIISTAAANVKEYYEGNLNIDYYGYGAPSNTQYPPGDNNGKKYLDRRTGYYYTCNGTTWVRSAQPLQEMTDLMSSEISQSAREVKASVSSAIQQWDTTGYYISAYGIGYPTEADFPPSQYTNAYYLDQQSGTIYRSNGSSWSYWTYCELITTDIYGELAVKIDEDDDGTIISLINGSANHINFVADNMFTVSAPNFSVDRNGNIEATNATLEGQTNFADIGYVGSTTVGDDTGIGLRNNAGTGAVVIGPTAGNLWLKGANVVCYLGSYGFLPWTSSVNLGSQTKKWSTLYCDDISCSNPPWSSSDKRMKDVHGTIEKVRDFYMALKPLQYTFKKGVDYENPEDMRYGLIAQDVLKTYKKCYNTDKQGIVQKRKILESGTKEVVGDTEKYVINYDELHAFHIAMIQELRAEVDNLKAEIKALRKEK